MDKLEIAARRGDEAARIVNSEMFNAAFDTVRQALIQQWEQLPTSDAENARDIHRRLKCLIDVRTALVEHINTGKLAEREMSGREKATKALRNVGRSMSNAFASRN